MNKSNSQPTINTKQHPKPKPKSKSTSQFVYKIEDDSYIFQTKDLFMQIQFHSAIKQICQYLQQYEKYNFLSHITSIGIKAYQQKQFQQKITTKINNQYHKYLQKTMGYIQQMIMNVHYMKFQMWHYYSKIIQGYQNHILNNNIDCYGFNISQFDSQYQQAKKQLADIHEKKSSEKINQIKLSFRINKKNIQKKIIDLRQNMYVKNPYKPQNIKNIQIQSDLVFNQYFKKVIFNTIELEEAFDVRFHSAYDGIRQFSQFIKDYSIRGQRLSFGVIKQFNQNLTNTISKTSQTQQQREQKKHFDFNEYSNQWKKNNKIIPAIRNNIQRVNLSNKIIIKDQNVSDTFTANQIIKSNHLKYDREQQLFANRVPANNPYIDYWDHRYDRDKLRNLHMYYELPKKNKQIVNNKKFLQKPKRKINKQRKYISESHYAFLLKQRQEQQKIVWQNQKKQKPLIQSTSSPYKIYQQNSKNKQYQQYNNLDEREVQNQLQRQQRIIDKYKIFQQKLQKQQKNQDQFVLANLKKATKQRNYQQFAIKFGIKDPKRQCTNTKVFRYGIQICRRALQNKDIPKLQQFLCGFLRQKLFRDFERYKDRQSMPLILNTKPAQQFCNWRTIKRLGQLTQSFKRYFVWCSQVIKYQQITTVDKQTIGKFTIYAYTKIKNSQSLLFQLKRRLNFKVVGEVIQRYQYGDSLIEATISKLELIHRLIFNQHMETSNSQFSYVKGLQIFNLIIKQLVNESKNGFDKYE